MQKAKPELETEGLCNTALTAHLEPQTPVFSSHLHYLCLCLLISKAELQFLTILADTFGEFCYLRDMRWHQDELWLWLWLRNGFPSQGVDVSPVCMQCEPKGLTILTQLIFLLMEEPVGSSQGWSHLESLEKPGTQWWPPGFWSWGYREPKAH